MVEDYERVLAMTQTKEDVLAAWEAGKALTLDEAVVEAMQLLVP